MKSKQQLVYGLIVLLIILLSPVLVTMFYKEKGEVTETKNNDSMVQLKVEDTGVVKSMYLEDYIKGVVAAEMPASYEIEALKAQAVAARTYTYRKLLAGNKVMSTDYRIGQAYLGEEQLKQRWGKHYNDYMAKVNEAVLSTKGEIMAYNEQPIEAVYHAISAGSTQDALDIWNFQLPYLQSVDSSFDKKAPDYETSFTLSDEEAKEQLKAYNTQISLTDEPLVEQMAIVERNDSGYIVSLKVGDTIISGEDLRNAFSCRSSNMSIKQKNDTITIATRGYGHGVGMSQFGANALAKEGKKYKKILEHYYVGASLMTIDS